MKHLLENEAEIYKLPKEIEDRFDNRFTLESQGCSECGGFELIDNSEIRFPKGTYYCEYDLEKIKSFIAQILQEEKERLVGEIDKIRLFTPPDRSGSPMFTLKDVTAPHNRGFNSAVDKVINLIKK